MEKKLDPRKTVLEKSEDVIEAQAPQNAENDEQIPIQRPRKAQQPPSRLQDFEVICNNIVDDDGELIHYAIFADCDPLRLEEVVQDDRWINAIEEEIKAIEKNNTWQLIDIPVRKKAIEIKWIFKTKKKLNGEVERYKTRLVAEGYKQQPGIDYQKVFSLIARIEIVKLIVSFVVQSYQKIYKIDMKSDFLNGSLNEIVYVKQPQGFIK